MSTIYGIFAWFLLLFFLGFILGLVVNLQITAKLFCHDKGHDHCYEAVKNISRVLLSEKRELFRCIETMGENLHWSLLIQENPR
ncbi:MAG: hypothetical protein EA361_13080 [Bacteroidetes bacterium]|nr:MAG: hypothetical protein EA361_13080 [Bacteroidota bacterium]